MATIKRTIQNVPAGTYIVRARSINGFGVPSDWSEAAMTETATPNFAAGGGGGSGGGRGASLLVFDPGAQGPQGQTGSVGQTGPAVAGIIWDTPGPLVILNSDIYPVPGTYNYTSLVAYLTMAGTSNVVFSLYKNATLFRTFTVLYNSLPFSASIALSVSVGDRLQYMLTTPGAGAAGLTVVMV